MAHRLSAHGKRNVLIGSAVLLLGALGASRMLMVRGKMRQWAGSAEHAAGKAGRKATTRWAQLRKRMR